MALTEHAPRLPGWTRFAFGDFDCTVVTDGVLDMGRAATNFPTADPAEVDALLVEHHLDPDNVVLDQNLLVVDTGTHRVLFDSGVGTDADLGRITFGSQTGQALYNLYAAGIDPASIDVVALTHAHPDHCWGLVGNGDRLYPNARLAVGKADLDYWTDLDHVDESPSRHAADHFTGAHRNLLPYADRLILAEDGTEIVPGIEVIATPGHSPGHVVYRITSAGRTMICWGDLCHHWVLLLKRPSWSFQFDYDKPAATAQRHRLYEMVESNRYDLFAYHFPFPGLGHLRRDAEETYSWLPSPLELALPPGAARGIPEGSPLTAHAGDRT